MPAAAKPICNERKPKSREAGGTHTVAQEQAFRVRDSRDGGRGQASWGERGVAVTASKMGGRQAEVHQPKTCNVEQGGPQVENTFPSRHIQCHSHGKNGRKNGDILAKKKRRLQQKIISGIIEPSPIHPKRQKICGFQLF